MVESAEESEGQATVRLEYDPVADAASVEVDGPVGPEDIADLAELDQDRNVRLDARGHAVEYEFLNVRRHGVRLDDIADGRDRENLRRLFREAGFRERDWSTPRPAPATRPVG